MSLHIFRMDLGQSVGWIIPQDGIVGKMAAQDVKRGSREAFERAMARVPNVEPDEGDLLG
jgi:hypothetical protein